MTTLLLLALTACDKTPAGDTATADDTDHDGSDSGSDSGSDDGGSDDGASDDGGSDDGGSDDGGSDDGAGDDTGSDDGGDTDTGGADTADPGAPDCSGGSGWTPGGWLSTEGGGSAYIYVPKALPACAPLLFFGHGGSQPGSYIAGDWTGYDDAMLEELAESWGYVLIVPGVQEGNGSHSWSLSASTTTWLEALVESAWAGADLDRGRTWLIGTSAGGHIAGWQGLYELSYWTGIGSFSSGIGSYYDYPEPPPERLLPFYVAHDPEDIIVPYAYSVALAEALEEHGHDYLFEDVDRGTGGHTGWPEGMVEAALDFLNSHTAR
jgi:predicted esterase